MEDWTAGGQECEQYRYRRALGGYVEGNNKNIYVEFISFVIISIICYVSNM
jgi:hypothetical protein